MHRSLKTLAVALLVTAGACHHGASGVDARAPKPAPGSATVHVTNHFATEMEIFVTGSGTAHRLGLVAPGLERDFDLPGVVVAGGSVTFRAQPSGFGPRYESEEVRIRPGDTVDLAIATNLVGSRATVRMQR